MTTQVKICGISTPAIIDAAVDAGASHIGLVHYAPSPRHVELEQAAALRRRVPAHVKVVLLLVNAEPALTIQALQTVQPDIVQFHGNEAPEWLRAVRQASGRPVWKAVGVRDAAGLGTSQRYVGAADLLLYDAPAVALPAGALHGGTGTRFDWTLLSGFDHKAAWGLAGGLDPANVADAIRGTGASLVDVSSGVESAPGVKDVDKISAFLKAATS
jgi:phosphoribosylanthranilate isomerase